MTVLITGCYGFLGHATAVRLLNDGHTVIGVDKVHEAISPKAARIANLQTFPQFEFHDVNLASDGHVVGLFKKIGRPDVIIHYAGQYSVPLNDHTAQQFIDGNLLGYMNIMEAARRHRVSRVVYASSTFVQDGKVPTSIYGATKEFGERCGGVYAQHGITFVALRFGSTYGPFCRPDIGVMQLAKKLWGGHQIDVTQGGFNYKVAFVFVDDAVECVVRAASRPMELRYNVETIVAEDYLADLDDLLQAMEKHSGIKAKRAGELAPRQGFQIPTDKCDRLRALIDYAPSTKLDEGMRKFVEWYANHKH
jgi:UDP-glucuronate 4-epimerase